MRAPVLLALLGAALLVRRAAPFALSGAAAVLVLPHANATTPASSSGVEKIFRFTRSSPPPSVPTQRFFSESKQSDNT